MSKSKQKQLNREQIERLAIAYAKSFISYDNASLGEYAAIWLDEGYYMNEVQLNECLSLSHKIVAAFTTEHRVADFKYINDL